MRKLVFGSAKSRKHFTTLGCFLSKSMTMSVSSTTRSGVIDIALAYESAGIADLAYISLGRGLGKAFQGLEALEIGACVGQWVFLDIPLQGASNQFRNADTHMACPRLEAVMQGILQVYLGAVHNPTLLCDV